MLPDHLKVRSANGVSGLAHGSDESYQALGTLVVANLSNGELVAELLKPSTPISPAEAIHLMSTVTTGTIELGL
jgi:hypothetical protein